MVQELLKYQSKDASLREIELSLSGSEERKKAMSAKKFLEGYSENVNKLDQRAEELSAILKNLSKNYKDLIEKLNEFEPVVDSCEDEGEIAFYQKKADELLSKLSKLENEINALTEEMNALMANYTQMYNKGKLAQKQYNEFSVKYKELKENKMPEMKAIESELAELEKSIDEKMLAKYKAKRADKMYPILYQLNGNMCGKCMMELSMAEVNKLNNGEIIECDNCRCLIYKG